MPGTIGVNLRVTGHCSQGGRKYMEDFFSVAYQQTEDEKDLEYAFFGIYDGHGGSEAATYAKENLMDLIVKEKNFWSDNDDDVLRAIRDGYMKTHTEMWKAQEKWPKTASGLPSTAGTTASIAFIRHSKIYIGHVGDSAIILGYQEEGQDRWRARSLTQDHKPESLEEKTRIVNCGGKVVTKSGVPRVVWNRPRIGHQGPVRRNTPIDEIPFLAVARSLGDLWSYNSAKNEYVVSPEPDIDVVVIDTKKFRCLIFGTDGLWNMLSPQTAVGIVQDAEMHNEESLMLTRPERMWLNPSKTLVDRALDRWNNTRMRADNTSVVTLMLDPPGPSRAEVLQRKSAEVMTEPIEPGSYNNVPFNAELRNDFSSAYDNNFPLSGTATNGYQDTYSDFIMPQQINMEEPYSNISDDNYPENFDNYILGNKDYISNVIYGPLPNNNAESVQTNFSNVTGYSEEPYRLTKLQNRPSTNTCILNQQSDNISIQDNVNNEQTVISEENKDSSEVVVFALLETDGEPIDVTAIDSIQIIDQQSEIVSNEVEAVQSTKESISDTISENNETKETESIQINEISSSCPIENVILRAPLKRKLKVPDPNEPSPKIKVTRSQQMELDSGIMTRSRDCNSVAKKALKGRRSSFSSKENVTIGRKSITKNNHNVQKHALVQKLENNTRKSLRQSTNRNNEDMKQYSPQTPLATMQILSKKLETKNFVSNPKLSNKSIKVTGTNKEMKTPINAKSKHINKRSSKRLSISVKTFRKSIVFETSKAVTRASVGLNRPEIIRRLSKPIWTQRPMQTRNKISQRWSK